MQEFSTLTACAFSVIRMSLITGETIRITLNTFLRSCLRIILSRTNCWTSIFKRMFKVSSGTIITLSRLRSKTAYTKRITLSTSSLFTVRIRSIVALRAKNTKVVSSSSIKLEIEIFKTSNTVLSSSRVGSSVTSFASFNSWA